MDEVVTSSIRVLLDNGLADPRRFFESVGEVLTEFRESGTDLTVDAFTERFVEQAGRDGFPREGEEFARHLRDNDGQEILRRVEEASTDELVAEFEAVAAEDSADAAPAADEPYDEETWYQFVAESGARWNGDLEVWDQFREWFLFYADERGVLAPATSFLDAAEAESDRIAFFATYGIEIAVVADEPGVEEDPEQWQAFLAEFGPSWNGAEENWEAFLPYFQHHAGERGVAMTAQAFLANAPTENADRVAYFVQYGIPLLPQAADATDAAANAENAAGSDAGAADDIPVEQAQAQFEETVAAAPEVPPELEQSVSEAFADLVREMPEAANLTSKEMQELLASEEMQAALRSVSAEPVEQS